MQLIKLTLIISIICLASTQLTCGSSANSGCVFCSSASGSYCTSCKTGFFFSSPSATCTACAKNVLTCTNATYALTCSRDSVLSSGACISCVAASTNSAGTTTTGFSAGCSTCTVSGSVATCTACLSGYILTSAYCYSCTAASTYNSIITSGYTTGCSTCSQSSGAITCTLCAADIFLVQMVVAIVVPLAVVYFLALQQLALDFLLAVLLAASHQLPCHAQHVL